MTVYFANDGDDDAVTNSMETPYKTLEKFQTLTFTSANPPAFKRGDRWDILNSFGYDALKMVSQNGTDGNPIDVRSWGDWTLPPPVFSTSRVFKAWLKYNKFAPNGSFENWDGLEYSVDCVPEGMAKWAQGMTAWSATDAYRIPSDNVPFNTDQGIDFTGTRSCEIRNAYGDGSVSTWNGFKIERTVIGGEELRIDMFVQKETEVGGVDNNLGCVVFQDQTTGEEITEAGRYSWADTDNSPFFTTNNPRITGIEPDPLDSSRTKVTIEKKHWLTSITNADPKLPAFTGITDVTGDGTSIDLNTEHEIFVDHHEWFYINIDTTGRTFNLSNAKLDINKIWRHTELIVNIPATTTAIRVLFYNRGTGICRFDHVWLDDADKFADGAGDPIYLAGHSSRDSGGVWHSTDNVYGMIDMPSGETEPRRVDNLISHADTPYIDNIPTVFPTDNFSVYSSADKLLFYRRDDGDLSNAEMATGWTNTELTNCSFVRFIDIKFRGTINREPGLSDFDKPCVSINGTSDFESIELINCEQRSTFPFSIGVPDYPIENLGNHRIAGCKFSDSASSLMNVRGNDTVIRDNYCENNRRLFTDTGDGSVINADNAHATTDSLPKNPEVTGDRMTVKYNTSLDMGFDPITIVCDADDVSFNVRAGGNTLDSVTTDFTTMRFGSEVRLNVSTTSGTNDAKTFNAYTVASITQNQIVLSVLPDVEGVPDTRNDLINETGASAGTVTLVTSNAGSGDNLFSFDNLGQFNNLRMYSNIAMGMHNGFMNLIDGGFGSILSQNLVTDINRVPFARGISAGALGFARWGRVTGNFNLVIAVDADDIYFDDVSNSIKSTTTDLSLVTENSHLRIEGSPLNSTAKDTWLTSVGAATTNEIVIAETLSGEEAGDPISIKYWYQANSGTLAHNTVAYPGQWDPDIGSWDQGHSSGYNMQFKDNLLFEFGANNKFLSLNSIGNAETGISIDGNSYYSAVTPAAPFKLLDGTEVNWTTWQGTYDAAGSVDDPYPDGAPLRTSRNARDYRLTANSVNHIGAATTAAYSAYGADCIHNQGRDDRCALNYMASTELERQTRRTVVI